MYKKAVIENITEGKAVLLIGETEEEKVIPINKLPKGANVGDWLQLRFDNGQIIKITIDKEETEKVKERIKEKMKKLRERIKK